MGKRVKVVTACGEEYVYQYEQEVDTVEVVEEEKRVTDFTYKGDYFIWVSRSSRKAGFYFAPDGRKHYVLKGPNGEKIAHFRSDSLKGLRSY